MLMSIFALTIACYVCYQASLMWKNYRVAKTMGVPIIFSPIGARNITWTVLKRLTKPITRRLPFEGWRWMKVPDHSWQFNEKSRTHEELGKIFVLVTPIGNELFVADAEVITQILTKKGGFQKPMEMLAVVNVFGKNLATVEGTEWQRHRKIASPPFNERNSELVWNESLSQAEQMLQYWRETEDEVTTTVPSDTMSLGLHILTWAGLGLNYRFRSAMGKPDAGYTLNYRDCVASVLDNIFLIAFSSKIPKYAPSIFKRVEKARIAGQEFQNYMVEMVETEKRNVGNEGHENLLRALLRNSKEAQSIDYPGKMNGEKNRNLGGLSDSEIFGNIFMFNLAGHESTANTIAYSIYFFAAHPEWQDWIGEEIDAVLAANALQGQNSDNETQTLQYQEIYPQLKRCLAVMYETLRLYGPVVQVPKETGANAATVSFDGRELTVPPHTAVHCNMASIHVLPEYWGTSALQWIPGRWIKPSTVSEPSTDADAPATEEIFTPPKGTFIPFADGPRVCPGKKFAQVEFVAVLVALFAEWRVEVIPKEGESVMQARERVEDVIKDSELKLTLKIRDPGRVKFRWVRK